MDRRYQIFVSSTYVDLIGERAQVIKSILKMGHIPVGMEMFNADDAEQWATIKREIDRSDYYVLLLAHRYGSTVSSKNGISYTEKEFDYAGEIGVPRISFMIQDGVPWKPEFIDDDPVKRKKLGQFKAKVKKRPVGFWTDDANLGLEVALSLQNLIANNPRTGWQRASEDSGRALATMTRLIDDNAQLLAENQRLRTQAGERVPVLDCQFVSEDEKPLGRELFVAPPDLKAAENLRQQRIGEMEALIDQIDAPARAKAANVLTEAFELSRSNPFPKLAVSSVLEAMMEPYEFDPKRLQKVLELLRPLTDKRPRQTWKFENLKRQKSIVPGITSYRNEPAGGDDLQKYTRFTELERLIHLLDEDLKEAAYSGVHREARLRVYNPSRIAAEDLTVGIDFPAEVGIGLDEFSATRRPSLELNVREFKTFSVLVPEDRTYFTNFVIDVSSVEQINFTVRVIGRNLPEAQVIPLTIRVGEPPTATEPNEPTVQVN